MARLCVRAVIAGSACVAASAASGQTFYEVPLLAGSPVNAAWSVSADGRVVVGASGGKPFRWIVGEPASVELAILGGPLGNGSANAVSADGSVIVGESGPTGSVEACTWTNGVVASLGAGAGSTALGVSADGAVVAGFDALGGIYWDAARVLVGIPGTLEARGVSSDGSKIVGLAEDNFDLKGFSFAPAGGTVTLLEDFAGSFIDSEANAVSGDGTKVVGKGRPGSASTQCGTLNIIGRAASWTTNPSTPGDLGALQDVSLFSTALGTNADGSIVVGYSFFRPVVCDPISELRATIWDANNGTRELGTVAAAAGVTIPSGWTLRRAWSVSGDGNVVVGTATDSQGSERAFAIEFVTAGTLCHDPVCIADFDDGTGSGTPDGGVTIDDLIYYLALFDVGDVCGDVDDGSGTGTPDEGVTIDDLIYYLARFDVGC